MVDFLSQIIWIVSQIVWIFIIGFFLWGLIKKNWTSFCSNATITFGMIGTFCGIAYGLLNFNTENIDASVPDLLTGMKIAFFTSIAGMFFSIILKVIVQRRDSLSFKEDPDVEIVSLLKEIKQNTASSNSSVLLGIFKDFTEKMNTAFDTMSHHSKENYEMMKSIEKSISGDGETTLLTNIQKLRTNTIDGLASLKESNEKNLNDLITAFKEFAQFQAENNTKAFIQALEEVIRDFNSKLTEQFGENFKHLNSAVEKLVVWQDKYKDFVEKMSDQFQTAVSAIDECHKSLVIITSQADSFNDSASNLQTLLQNLNTNLVGIDELSKNIGFAYHQIEENLKNITNEMLQYAKRTNDVNNEQVTRLVQSTESTINELQRLSLIQQDGIRKQQDLLTASSESALKEMNQRLIDFDKNLKDELETTFANFGSAIIQLYRKLEEEYKRTR